MIPFLRDYAANVRLLIAVPILILAESAVDRRWRITVLEFVKSGLVTAKELPAFEAVIEKTLRLRDRMLPEAIMLGAASPAPLYHHRILMGNVSNWHTMAPGEISMAGWWFNLVCTPLVRFLMVRWLWRMILWTFLLWRLPASISILLPHTLTWQQAWAFYPKRKRRSAPSFSLAVQSSLVRWKHHRLPGSNAFRAEVPHDRLWGPSDHVPRCSTLRSYSTPHQNEKKSPVGLRCVWLQFTTSSSIGSGLKTKNHQTKQCWEARMHPHWET